MAQNDDKPVPLDPEQEFETKFKQRLKERYDIDDDADTHKTKVKRWREIEEVVPHYEVALQNLTQRLNQPKVEDLGPAPRQDDDEVELNSIRSLAQTNPVDAMIRLNRFNQKVLDRKLEDRDKAIEGRLVSQSQGARTQEAAGQYLAANWPEVYDAKTDLHKVGKAIYFNEMTETERRSPTGFLRAAEAAAARLGLPPKSRRQAPAADAPDDNEVSSQRPEGSNARPRREPADLPSLNEKERKMQKAMGLDEKGFKTTKAARKAGKTIRVE